MDSAPIFERVVTGIVRSTVGDPLTAWSTFYANSLAVLRHPERAAVEGPGRIVGPAAGEPGPPVELRSAATPPEASLAGFAPVHARALDEVVGSAVADLGACFGFLPLLMAERGPRRARDRPHAGHDAAARGGRPRGVVPQGGEPAAHGGL